MAPRARIYIALVLMAGAAALAKSFLEWHTTDWVGFILYTVVSLLASGYKLRLPGITATVSSCFLMMLIGIMCLNLPEAVIGGCLAVAFQCVWHSSSRPRPIKILFSVSNIAIAITVSWLVFYSEWLHRVGFEFALRLVVLGCVYFISSTLPVGKLE